MLGGLAGLGGALGGTSNIGSDRLLALAQQQRRELYLGAGTYAADITTTTISGNGTVITATGLDEICKPAPKTIREELQQETDEWLDGVL